MNTFAPQGPASATLADCASEPIHLAGAVQSFGYLLAVSQDWIVTRASANAGRFLDRALDSVLGVPLTTLFLPDAVHAIRGRLQGLRGADAFERMFGVQLTADGPEYDVALYLAGPDTVIEAEPRIAEDLHAANMVRGMTGRLQQAAGFEAFCREAARQMRALTGFDRVMLYRFDRDGSGEVLAESARPRIGSYLGLRFPASDIPPQARALYERNLSRSIADVWAEPVPVLPATAVGQAPDLSMSVLRAVSPVHVEYLRNMEVAASLSVSLVRDGRLWGLFACHHLTPRRLSLERRTAAELLGQMASWVMESREREQQTARETAARQLHDRVVARLWQVPDQPAADLLLGELTRFLACDGIGLVVDGEVTLLGVTPGHAGFARLCARLDHLPAGRVMPVERLAELLPGVDPACGCAGFLAVPIPRQKRDYVVFFRREVIRTITWAGNPQKPVAHGRISPRRSFAAWEETVRGSCAPWTDSDLRLAEALRTALLEAYLRRSEAPAPDA